MGSPISMPEGIRKRKGKGARSRALITLMGEDRTVDRNEEKKTRLSPSSYKGEPYPFPSAGAERKKKVCDWPAVLKRKEGRSRRRFPVKEE